MWYSKRNITRRVDEEVERRIQLRGHRYTEIQQRLMRHPFLLKKTGQILESEGTSIL